MEPTDFTSLKTEVEAAKALAEADYTIATWKSFAGELQEAEDILTKTDASQAEVNEALEHLQGAEKELQKVTVTLDKTADVYKRQTVYILINFAISPRQQNFLPARSFRGSIWQSCPKCSAAPTKINTFRNMPKLRAEIPGKNAPGWQRNTEFIS